ncbi:MAG: EpsG family protein [Haemophilus haemolyticus]|nr:EpsG family protein [Haemophilus haemolyticus]
MLIYILACFLSFLIGLKAKGKYKTFITLIAMVPPFIVSSLRYDNGSDYLMYKNIFESIRDYGKIESVKSLEIGFTSLIDLSLLFSDSSIFFFSLVALVILTFYFCGISNISNNIPFSILLFFITGTFFDTFNGLRQYIAAAILFYSICYIINNSAKKYIFFVMLAFLFHYTALVMLPLYWIVRRKYSIKLISLVILFFILGSQFIDKVFHALLSISRYSFYLESEELVVVPTISSILYTSIIGVISLYFYYLYRDKLSNRFVILFNIQMIAWVTALLSLSIPLAMRWQYYFVPVSIIFIPELLSIIRYKYNRWFISLFLFLIYTITLIYGMLYNGWFDAYPYNLTDF